MRSVNYAERENISKSGYALSWPSLNCLGTLATGKAPSVKVPGDTDSEAEAQKEQGPWLPSRAKDVLAKLSLPNLPLPPQQDGTADPYPRVSRKGSLTPRNLKCCPKHLTLACGGDRDALSIEIGVLWYLSLVSTPCLIKNSKRDFCFWFMLPNKD